MSSAKWFPFCLSLNVLKLAPLSSCDLYRTSTHCGLVTPYDDVDLGQHQLEGDGLLTDGTKPLLEPKLTNHQLGLVELIWGQFHRKYSRYLSWMWIWEIPNSRLQPHPPGANELTYEELCNLARTWWIFWTILLNQHEFIFKSRLSWQKKPRKKQAQEKMPSYQYRDLHVKDQDGLATILSLTWESHLERQSLYWDGALIFICSRYSVQCF